MSVLSDEFYSVQQVKDIFNISDSTVRKWLKEGILEGHVFPGTRKIYIPKQHIEGMLDILRSPDTLSNKKKHKKGNDDD
jgi:excisionase family DNA binding protein